MSKQEKAAGSFNVMRNTTFPWVELGQFDDHLAYHARESVRVYGFYNAGITGNMIDYIATP